MIHLAFYRFNWEFKSKRGPNYFKISPSKGFLAPGNDIRHTITFTPTKVSSCLFREEAFCKMSEKFPTLMLVMTGRCEEMSPITETLYLKAPLRDSKSNVIVVENE